MEIFKTSYYILCIVLIVFSIIFFFVPVPKDKSIRNYKISLRLFSVSYIFLAIYCIVKLDSQPELLGIPFLIAAHFQAIVLGLSHVNLINPAKLTLRHILRHIIPWILFIVLAIIDRVFSAHVTLDSYAKLLPWNATNAWAVYDTMLREIWFVTYICVTIYFGCQFFREERMYKTKAENFTSDNSVMNLPAARSSFILALSIAGTTLLITTCLSWLGCTLLNFAILLLYIGMGLLYIQYPKRFFEVSMVMRSEIEHVQNKEEHSFDVKQKDTWIQIRQQIIDEGLYKQKGITLDEISRETTTNRTTLSNMINEHENVNFNTFINTLRITDAQILLSTTEKTIAEISDIVGYSEQGNFSRQFKQIVGCSPSAYRNNSKKSDFTPPKKIINI